MAILSVGLAPGLTNLLASEVARGLKVERIDIGVLLGLGDHHGPAAIDWTLERLGSCDGDKIRDMRFRRVSSSPALPFDFADQHVLARRHGWPTTTHLAFDSPLITRSSLRLAARMARSAIGRRIMRWSTRALRWGSDRTALVALATGAGTTSRMVVHAKGEADVTTIMAAEVATVSLASRRPGVWHIEELFRLSDLEDALRAAHVTFQE